MVLIEFSEWSDQCLNISLFNQRITDIWRKVRGKNDDCFKHDRSDVLVFYCSEQLDKWRGRYDITTSRCTSNGSTFYICFADAQDCRSPEACLIQDLMSSYDPRVRPVFDPYSALDLNVTLNIHSLHGIVRNSKLLDVFGSSYFSYYF